jgi:hypothetical protein
MDDLGEPGLKIEINRRGIRTVLFCGDGFDAEAEVSRLYQRVRHLIIQMDRLIKEDLDQAGTVQ